MIHGVYHRGRENRTPTFDVSNDDTMVIHGVGGVGGDRVRADVAALHRHTAQLVLSCNRMR